MSRYYDLGRAIAQARINRAKNHVKRIERGEITASRAWGYIYRIIYGRSVPWPKSDCESDYREMCEGFKDEARDFVRQFIGRYYDQLSRRQQEELPNDWLPLLLKKTYYTPLIARLPLSSSVRMAYERGELSYDEAVYAASIIIARHDYTCYDDYVNGDNRDELRAELRHDIEAIAEKLREREYAMNHQRVMHQIEVA